MKKNYLLRAVAVFVLSLSALCNLNAQVPQGFNYQAVLRNSNGTIMQNQTVTMQFTIHETTFNGTTVYSETQGVTTNNYGLVTLEIGQGTVVSGNFSSIHWGTNSYFLDVQAEYNSIWYDLGATQFISVPYAMVADSALHGGVGGTAGGDLSGTYPNPTVAKIQTVPVSSTTPTNGQVLQYNGTNWTPTTQNSSNAWSLTGNSGTNPSTNFLGTTDIQPLIFRINSQKSGRIDSTSTFLGYKAGFNNQNNNTGIGSNALYSNTTGISNVANGWKSLYSNTTGSNNTAIGDGTLYTNISGNSNQAIGTNSLNSNTTGSRNIAIGNAALEGNTTASQNTAIGFDALTIQSYNNNGTAWNSENVAIGYNALYSNQPTSTTTGWQNIAIGNYSLQFNTIGYRNTATGVNALYSNTAGNANTANGLAALEDNTTGNNNTAIGMWALNFNNTGSDNTVLGYSAGYGTTGANFNQCTFIGDNSYPTQNRTNVTMLGYGIADGQCTGNSQVCIGNTAITQIRAQVSGITAYSDARFKTNIKDNVAGLDFILKLKPVTYNVRPKELHKIWNTPDSLVNKIDFSEAEKETRIGFVAQDVEKAAKECGFNFPGIDVPRNDKEVYALRYVDFIMPMVKAIQELNAHNVVQQKMIDQLQKQIADLQEQINKLQSRK
jgi:hypothetical protein